jgi:hypothetical protein
MDYAGYFRELLDGLSMSGLVIDSQYTPAVEVVTGGKYLQTCRDPRLGRSEVFEHLRCYFGKQRAA